ncbi:exported hypothetical protein [Rhodococcus sp. RD6.2]|nr:exported hypothetical protein [Rhodococcus sp. RD6.2]
MHDRRLSEAGAATRLLGSLVGGMGAGRADAAASVARRARRCPGGAATRRDRLGLAE